MIGDRIVPRSEVIRAILLEDSPCCGMPAPSSTPCPAATAITCTAPHSVNTSQQQPGGWDEVGRR